MAWYLVFWRHRSTTTVVPATSATQARRRALQKQKRGYGAITAARRANAQDSRLIRKGVWVLCRRDGSSPPVRHPRAEGEGPAAAKPLLGLAMAKSAKELES